MPHLDEIPLLASSGLLAEANAPSLSAAVAELSGRLPDVQTTLVVNDPQRHTNTAAVLRALEAAGFSAAFRVLFACGTHRFSDLARQEFEHRLADDIPQSIREFAWHDCHAANLEWINSSDSWRCHPWLLDDSVPLLAIGSVEPHYFAGLTGSHKTVTIGCASHQAIQSNHEGALSPDSRPFALIGNPVHDGVAAMLGALEARRPVLAVNLLQEGRNILAAASGDPLSAVYALASVAQQVFARTVDRPADALILDVTGPLACSFYQAEKAIKNNENAVGDGGLLVLCATCPQGVGQDHFVSLLRQAGTHAAAVACVSAHGYKLGDHKAVKLRHLTDPDQRNVRVAIVSEGLSADSCRILGLHKAASVEAALADAGLSPARHRIYRVADAANMVVMVKPT